MGKGYFSKQDKCDRKNYAPCYVNKEQLADFLQERAGEIIAFAKELLKYNYPQHFEMPKLLLLPVAKTQTFGKYAYNMVLQEEEKLAQANEEDKPAILAKLSQMRANIKIERFVRGSFFADGGIVIYYCNVCQLCEKEQLDFTSYITSVFAHEIFHALHFASCDATKGWQQMSYWNGNGFEAGKMSTVLSTSPRIADTTAARIRIITRKSANCSRKMRSVLFCWPEANSLGPCVSNRAFASALERPSSLHP